MDFRRATYLECPLVPRIFWVGISNLGPDHHHSALGFDFGMYQAFFAYPKNSCLFDGPLFPLGKLRVVVECKYLVFEPLMTTI